MTSGRGVISGVGKSLAGRHFAKSWFTKMMVLTVMKLSGNLFQNGQRAANYPKIVTKFLMTDFAKIVTNFPKSSD